MAPRTGRALVAAMCLGQVGNLLPHVVVPAIMAQYLMPLWNLSASQAGLMASAYAFGYMLAVPVLTPFQPRPSSGHPLDFRPVFRNRAALGYIFGYGAHCFELYGMRTWLVAFWTFVVARNAGDVLLGPVAISVMFTLLSLPASLLGNEAALRYGRHRAISAIMIASAAVALAIGFGTTLPAPLLLMLVLIYGFTVPGDSGALTSGMSASAVAQQRGATMALHSTVGFG